MLGIIKKPQLLTRMLVLGAILVSLTACVTQPVRVAKPATDLQILKLGVHALTEERHPTGAIQHPDQAIDNKELMAFAVDSDNVTWLSNKDKRRIKTFVDDAVRVIAESRAEVCSWWNISCKRRRSSALEPFKPPE